MVVTSDASLTESLTGGAGAKRGWGWRKVMCVFAQFAPYFLMWYGFFLIVNGIVASWCEVDYVGCTSTDASQVGAQNLSTNDDMFACSKLSSSSGVGIFIILSVTWAALTMITQFIVLCLKVGPSPFGSLALVVWLEVAKERGSIFNTFTRVSALVILVSSVYSGYAYISTFDGNLNDLLSNTFQAVASLYTAYQLSTYNSPVTTIYHARMCPEIYLEYPWWQPSEEVMSNLHLILAINPKTAEEILLESAGSPEKLSSVLSEKNLDHLDSELLASMGAGAEGVKNLEIVRVYFSSPPTKEAVRQIKDEEHTGFLKGLFQGAGSQDNQTMLREMTAPTTASEDAINELRQQLEEKDRTIAELLSRLEEMGRQGPVTPEGSPPETPVSDVISEKQVEVPERAFLINNVQKVAMDVLTATDYGQAVQAVLSKYPTNEGLYELVMNYPALVAELTSGHGPAQSIRRTSQRVRGRGSTVATTALPTLAPAGSVAGRGDGHPSASTANMSSNISDTSST
eukprot:TRINITY_DN10477_c0_g1_i1.p1 TRINITY_DN10477_c0_g1~~TRINITY_DN10477_c0_g1_i1.p1  ORF type:complete len:527 (+),score=146.01 TRINITY_DN10477_c0_g1_i1:40-1581(+)